MNGYLEGLKLLKESEDHIEFKEVKSDFNYNGGSHTYPKKRRHCVLGYVAALANELVVVFNIPRQKYAMA